MSKEIALAPHGKCKMCDYLIMKPEACFVPEKLGTQYIDAPYCEKRKLHYDYIRRIDEGERDCRYFKRDGIS
jgi:hypothetical protein